jgi:hypothetical protein
MAGRYQADAVVTMVFAVDAGPPKRRPRYPKQKHEVEADSPEHAKQLIDQAVRASGPPLHPGDEIDIQNLREVPS